jgi:hypothetical protein
MYIKMDNKTGAIRKVSTTDSHQTTSNEYQVPESYSSPPLATTALILGGLNEKYRKVTISTPQSRKRESRKFRNNLLHDLASL